MRRTAWLVLSPWLAVAVAAAVGLGVAWALTELWTTGDGGLGDLGPALMAVACGALVACGGSAALMWLAARRVLAPAPARRAVGWAFAAAVGLLVVASAALGLLDTGGALLGAVVLPALLPAAGTVSFLLADVHEPRAPRGPRALGRARTASAAGIGALAGLLVGGTVGALVDIALLGPSPAELQAEGVALVPEDFSVDVVTQLNGGAFVTASAPEAAATATVAVTARAAGWQVVRPSYGGRAADLMRPGLVAYASIDDGGSPTRFSVSVYRASAGPAGALVGGATGAIGAGVAAVVMARRRDGRRQPPTTQPWGSASLSASGGPQEPGA